MNHTDKIREIIDTTFPDGTVDERINGAIELYCVIEHQLSQEEKAEEREKLKVLLQ